MATAAPMAAETLQGPAKNGQLSGRRSEQVRRRPITFHRSDQMPRAAGISRRRGESSDEYDEDHRKAKDEERGAATAEQC